MIRKQEITTFEFPEGAVIWDVRDTNAYTEAHVKGAVNRAIEIGQVPQPCVREPRHAGCLRRRCQHCVGFDGFANVAWVMLGGLGFPVAAEQQVV